MAEQNETTEGVAPDDEQAAFDAEMAEALETAGDDLDVALADGDDGDGHEGHTGPEPGGVDGDELLRERAEDPERQARATVPANEVVIGTVDAPVVDESTYIGNQ